MALKDDVINKVSIASYFYDIIVPQLGSYYSDYPVDFDARPVACCPLHDEDTPSFRFYEATNSFYCFGCRAGGDIINLHRLFTERQTGVKPTYSESIKFLSDYFLRGNENAKSVIAPKKITIASNSSTNVQLASYNMYCSKLEGQLLNDRTVTQEQKETIWNAMNNMNILVEKEFVRADNAVKYIKYVVSETI